MGLRVKRKGPCTTIAVVGRLGFGVVPARRNKNTALADRPSQTTSRAHAAARAAGGGPSGQRWAGTKRWTEYPRANRPA